MLRPPPSAAASGSPLHAASPGTPLLLARRPIPFVAASFFCECSFFVRGQTEVVLGLNRLDDSADERLAVLLGCLLKELLDVVPDDGHPRCPTVWRQARRFDLGLRYQFQDSRLSLR